MSTQTSDEILQEKIFSGKTLKENLQWIIARNNTGYTYEELLDGDEEEMGIDLKEEIQSIDETVNLLAHLSVYTARPSLPLDQSDEELNRILSCLDFGIHGKGTEKGGYPTYFVRPYPIEIEDRKHYIKQSVARYYKQREEEIRAEAFNHGQRVAEYQVADRLYGDVTSIYLFAGDKVPKHKDNSASHAGELLKDCEKYMNDNRKEYVQYLATLQTNHKEKEL